MADTAPADDVKVPDSEPPQAPRLVSNQPPPPQPRRLRTRRVPNRPDFDFTDAEATEKNLGDLMQHIENLMTADYSDEGVEKLGEINILLVGEPGSGKSSFINTIFQAVSPAPIGIRHVTCAGSSVNSITSGIISYPLKKFAINIIDTKGIQPDSCRSANTVEALFHGNYQSGFEGSLDDDKDSRFYLRGNLDVDRQIHGIIFLCAANACQDDMKPVFQSFLQALGKLQTSHQVGVTMLDQNTDREIDDDFEIENVFTRHETLERIDKVINFTGFAAIHHHVLIPYNEDGTRSFQTEYLAVRLLLATLIEAVEKKKDMLQAQRQIESELENSQHMGRMTPGTRSTY